MKADVDRNDSGDITSESSGAANVIETGDGTHQLVDSEDDIETGCSQWLNTDDNDDRIVEFTQACQPDTVVTVPVAGESVIGNNYTIRHVANGCAICLCEFEPGDQVTWAANKECPHIFHNTCILSWFLASGRNEQMCRRLHPERSTGDPLNDVITFPMQCPCCRQNYVKQSNENDVPHSNVMPETSPSMTEDEIFAT